MQPNYAKLNSMKHVYALSFTTVLSERRDVMSCYKYKSKWNGNNVWYKNSIRSIKIAGSMSNNTTVTEISRK